MKDPIAELIAEMQFVLDAPDAQLSGGPLYVVVKRWRDQLAGGSPMGDYTDTELACRGCMGPCGRCHTASTVAPDSIRGVIATEVQATAFMLERHLLGSELGADDAALWALNDPAKVTVETILASAFQRLAALVPHSPPEPLNQALDALEFAQGAIVDAICLEDGLDGTAGEAVIALIRAALSANGRVLMPLPDGEDDWVPSSPPEQAQNPPRRQGHDSPDWIARVAADIRDINPDYHDFECEVERLIRSASSPPQPDKP